MGTQVCVLLAAMTVAAPIPPEAEQKQAAALLQERFRAELKMEEVEPGRQAVVEVIVFHDLFNDDSLALVAKLPEVRRLATGTPKLTGSGFAHLRGLRHFRWLDLSTMPLENEELRHLKALPQLERLTITGLPVTDAGMKHIGKLSNLRWLFLIDTQVTDAGLAELRGLTKLERFCVTGPKITDKGVKHLESLTNLDHLNLSQTAITDTGLQCLKRFPKLNRLYLQGTQGVTDAGTDLIAALNHLEDLGLDGTSVSDAGAKKLLALKLRQLTLPDRISDEAFEEIKKTVSSPKAVMRLPWPR